MTTETDSFVPVCTVPLAHLRALMLCAADEKDPRKYIQGIYVDTQHDNLVATTGHILLAIRTATLPREIPPFTLPGMHIEHILKFARKTKQGPVAIAVKGQHIECTIGDTTQRMNALNHDSGSFPEYRKLFVPTTGVESAQFNPDLLATMKKALQEVVPSQEVFLQPHGDGPAFMIPAYGEGVLGLVMPLRVGATDESVEAIRLQFARTPEEIAAEQARAEQAAREQEAARQAEREARRAQELRDRQAREEAERAAYREHKAQRDAEDAQILAAWRAVPYDNGNPYFHHGLRHVKLVPDGRKRDGTQAYAMHTSGGYSIPEEAARTMLRQYQALYPLVQKHQRRYNRHDGIASPVTAEVRDEVRAGRLTLEPFAGWYVDTITLEGICHVGCQSMVAENFEYLAKRFAEIDAERAPKPVEATATPVEEVTAAA